MHRILVIYGPRAAGKASVATELARDTDFFVLTNHQIIDPLLSVSDYGSFDFQEQRRLITLSLISLAVKNQRKIILTRVFDFNNSSDKLEFRAIIKLAKEQGSWCSFVGLDAPLSVRLRRNKNRSRIAKKPIKSDVERSERFLLLAERDAQFFPNEGFVRGLRHVVIDNSLVSARRTSIKIKELCGQGLL